MGRVNNIAEKCAGLFLIGMVAAVSISVFARLFYTYAGISFSTTWAEELSRYLMVGSVFIGGAVAAYDLRLIGVDAFLTIVPAHIARWLRVAAHLFTLLFALLLVWKSTRLIELGLKQWSPAMEVPMAYVYSLMFVGCILMAANVLMHVIGELLNAGPWPQRHPSPPEDIAMIQIGKEHLS